MTMKVPYLNLPAQFSDPELFPAIEKVFTTCGFVNGPEVEDFEKAFAAECGTKFGMGVNSGTDALFLVLKALGVRENHEVITVSNSFVATAGAIAATGARPVFVDVNSQYLMDPEKIEAAITSSTIAIVPVHITGNPADMVRINAIAEKYGLHVIEDAAQAIGADISGKRVGSFGVAGCFSLHPLKNVTVAGDGGMVVTDSGQLNEKIRRLRNHGLIGRNDVAHFGYNSRLDTIQAIVGAHKLAGMEKVTQKRKENAALYDELLSPLEDYITIPERNKDANQVFHTYVVRVQDREGLIRYLARNNVETKIHYPVPIHLMQPCRKAGWKPGDLPQTEKQMKEILSLPIHQHLTREEISYVADCVKAFYKDAV